MPTTNTTDKLTLAILFTVDGSYKHICNQCHICKEWVSFLPLFSLSSRPKKLLAASASWPTWNMHLVVMQTIILRTFAGIELLITVISRSHLDSVTVFVYDRFSSHIWIHLNLAISCFSTITTGMIIQVWLSINRCCHILQLYLRPTDKCKNDGYNVHILLGRGKTESTSVV